MNEHRYIVMLIGILLLQACGQSSNGGEAEDPAVKRNGSIVHAVAYAVPAEQCPNGGITVYAGIDSNGNAVLDESERTTTQYVCNGANGANGADGTAALVVIASEPPEGGHCANGGSKVSVGPDSNGDGVLAAEEVTGVDYICDGADGANGTDGLNALLKIADDNTRCANGGKKITSGLDTNRNGALDEFEVTSTEYVCNGAGINWVNADSSVQAVANTGYIANSASQVVVTLPASPAVGDIVAVAGVGTGGWRAVAQNPDHMILSKNWAARESNRSWSAIASSADGTKVVAAVWGGQIYTSTDAGVTWTARDSFRYWRAVASSADGTRLVAAADFLYTSDDSGVTWTPRDLARGWIAVASSADGTKLVAVVQHGQIYTSIDSGVTWTARELPRWWNSVASSADGTKLVATVYDGQIYTSTDSGETWTPRETDRPWAPVASSADGTRLVAAVNGSGQIYTSTDSGVTWTARESNRNWFAAASSADGTKLAAVEMYGKIYISTDSGETWTVHESIRNWNAIASTADGRKLFATANGGNVYTGPVKSVSGGPYDSIQLLYAGSNMFTILSQEGSLIPE